VNDLKTITILWDRFNNNLLSFY